MFVFLVLDRIKRIKRERKMAEKKDRTTTELYEGNEKKNMTTTEIYETFEVHEIGKIIWLDGMVFVCEKCKRRYDFAIIYKDYDKPSCRICSSDLKITKTWMRILGVIHPKDGGW